MNLGFYQTSLFLVLLHRYFQKPSNAFDALAGSAGARVVDFAKWSANLDTEKFTGQIIGCRFLEARMPDRSQLSISIDSK